MSRVDLVSVHFGKTPREPRDDKGRAIPLTPGFARTTLDEARNLQLRSDGGQADVKHLWPVINRKTGVVDCVIGPCAFDEMLETWTALEGGEPPVAERRWVAVREP